MAQRSDWATRPARLPLLLQITVPALLTASFLSGILLWGGDWIQQRELRSPAWLHPVRVVHGLLYPFLALLVGALLAQHIRLGWTLKANRASGLVMEIIMLVLIVSPVGLYYFGDETWRAACLWVHRVCGLALPAALAFHWYAARRWVKRLPTPSP